MADYLPSPRQARPRLYSPILIDAMLPTKKINARKIAFLGCIARWYCEGRPQIEMAEELGVDENYVVEAIRTLRSEWASRRDDFNTRKDEELAKLDNLEQEAWQAWQRSCEERIVTRVHLERMRPSSQDEPVITEQVITKEARDGNPIYLEMVFRCIDRRIKMLGMDAPVRIQSDVTLVALAAKIAEDLDLDKEEILTEAERIFQTFMKPKQLNSG